MDSAVEGSPGGLKMVGERSRREDCGNAARRLVTTLLIRSLANGCMLTSLTRDGTFLSRTARSHEPENFGGMRALSSCERSKKRPAEPTAEAGNASLGERFQLNVAQTRFEASPQRTPGAEEIRSRGYDD